MTTGKELSKELNTTSTVKKLMDSLEDEIADIKNDKLSVSKARLVLQARRTQMRGVENVLSGARIMIESEKVNKLPKSLKKGH